MRSRASGHSLRCPAVVDGAVLLVAQPAVQARDALADADSRLPAGGLAQAVDIRDVVALVAPPPAVAAQPRRRPLQLPDQLEHLEQAGLAIRAAAHVEDPAGRGRK